MFPFRHIVFPVDYSGACMATAPYVQQMAKLCSADVTVIHAYLPSAPYGGDAGWEYFQTLPPLEEIRAEEQRRLSAFVEESMPDVRTRLVVQPGDPAQTISSLVHHEGADLIMLPTHGCGVFRRIVLGSVTTKILHDLSCAVWTAQHAEDIFRQVPREYKSIICAVDFGEECLPTIKAAAAIARTFNARLTMVHSVLPLPGSWEATSEFHWKNLLDEAEQALKMLCRDAAVCCEVRVMLGSVDEVVHAAVTEEDANLVVVGRGKSQEFAGRLFSNLYSIVRESPCPVLSI